MKHYIEVWRKGKDGRTVRCLVNLSRLVSVTDEPGGCKMYMLGYCLHVDDSYDEVLERIAATEEERSASGAPNAVGGN